MAAVVVCARIVVGLCITTDAGAELVCGGGRVVAAPKVAFVGETGREEALPGSARGGIISDADPRLALVRLEVEDDEEPAVIGADVGASYRLASAMRAEGGAVSATLVGEVFRRCKSTVGRSLRWGEAVWRAIWGRT